MSHHLRYFLCLSLVVLLRFRRLENEMKYEKELREKEKEHLAEELKQEAVGNPESRPKNRNGLTCEKVMSSGILMIQKELCFLRVLGCSMTTSQVPIRIPRHRQKHKHEPWPMYTSQKTNGSTPSPHSYTIFGASLPTIHHQSGS